MTGARNRLLYPNKIKLERLHRHMGCLFIPIHSNTLGHVIVIMRIMQNYLHGITSPPNKLFLFQVYDYISFIIYKDFAYFILL